MLVNTAEQLLNRSEIKILESYCCEGSKVYKILLIINRYDKNTYSPLVVDNIIMTLCFNRRVNKIYFDVLSSTSRRSYSMFSTYKENLGDEEFAKYIKALNRQTIAAASAIGLAGRSAHIVRREAWHNSTLSACLFER